MTSPAADELSQLRVQLDEVSRREAWFRLKTVQDFQVLNNRLTALKKRVDELNDELGSRNTYIHELHVGRAHFEETIRARHADLEVFTQLLGAAEDERAALREKVGAMKSSWGWSLCAPLRALQRTFGGRPVNGVPAPVVSDVPAANFTYFLHTSPFRLYREDRFTLRGWALPADEREVTAVRVRLDDREFQGHYGLPEPEIAGQHGSQSANPLPGFEVEFQTPPGRHFLRLEACLEHRDWRSILSTPIWVQS